MSGFLNCVAALSGPGLACLALFLLGIAIRHMESQFKDVESEFKAVYTRLDKIDPAAIVIVDAFAREKIEELRKLIDGASASAIDAHDRGSLVRQELLIAKLLEQGKADDECIRLLESSIDATNKRVKALEESRGEDDRGSLRFGSRVVYKDDLGKEHDYIVLSFQPETASATIVNVCGQVDTVRTRNLRRR